MAEAALQGRNSAHASLTEAVRELSRNKEKDNPSVRILQSKYDKVVAAKEVLISKHITYGEKSKKDLQSAEMTDWLAEKLDPVNDLLDDVFIVLDEDETRTKNITLQVEKNTRTEAETAKKKAEAVVADKQCKMEEEIIAERITTMSEIIDDEEKSSKEDGLLVQAQFEEIEVLVGCQIKSWNHCKSLLEEGPELDNIFQRENDLRKMIIEGRSAAKGFIKITVPSASTEDDDASVGSSAASQSSFHSNTRIEKMGLPTFGGNCRAFARFKGDFNNIVVPNYTDEVHRLYVLKDKCLKGPAKTLVENLQTIEEIWERLESKYGNSSEVLNLVINDVKSMRVDKKDEERGLVILVDALEKGLQDLTAINARSEIANTYTINLIEEKLPTEIVKRWYAQESDEKTSTSTNTNSGEKRFEELLHFLKKERKNAEKLMQLRIKDKKEDEKKDTRNKNYSHFARNQNEDGRVKPNNSCLIHPNGNHLTRRCNVFLSKTVAERGKIVKDVKGCKLCLSVSHPGSPCPFELKWKPCGEGGCTGLHSRLIHGCGIPELSCHIRYTVSNLTPTDTTSEELTCSAAQYQHENNTLLLIQSSRTATGKGTLFWDDGSTLCLVSTSYVRREGLTGIKVTYDLITAGNVVTTHETMMFEIYLLDRKGDKHKINAYEISDICGQMSEVAADEFVKIFPSLKAKDIARKAGEIDLLIGSNYLYLHPIRIDCNQGMVLYKSLFGTGRVIAGSHQAVTSNIQLSASVRHHSHAQISNVRVIKSMGGIDCFTSDDLGIKIPPQCSRCKVCKDCTYEAHQISRIEQQELAVIRNNLVLDPVENRFTTVYPYKEDPSTLEDNRHQAVGLMKKLEKQLGRSSVVAEQYCKEFNDFIERGVIELITEQEMKEYKGPVNYVNHMPVYKPGSSSSPIRMVVNSSLSYNGKSFNDILMKGPNCLQDIYGIQLRFRKHKFALVCDIKKFYHTVHTTVTEKHLRRLVWRGMNLNEEPATYGFAKVTFGDRPAGAICSVALKETAETYKYIDQDAAEKIQDDSYCDDVVTGDETRERINELKESIPEITSKGGFEIKGFVTNGDQSAESRALLGTGEMGRVLGISWDPGDDEFSVAVRINLSKKYKGNRVDPDLTYEEIPKVLEIKVTRRILLGIVNSCYDVYGFLAPLLIQLKIALRNLFSKELNLSWDDPINEVTKEKWVKMLQLLKGAEIMRFPRRIKPDCTVGDPILVMCNDGSKDAMCCTAHVRWQLENGEFECRLLAAKSRVTPLRTMSIPRTEMQSAVMSVRLSKAIQHHMAMKFESVVHIVDSTCTLATLHKDTVGLKEFMGPRVAECLETTKPKDWNHVPSAENISDLATRCNATLEDISPESAWMKGPSWMRKPREEWPTSQDYSGAKIPDEDLIRVVQVSCVTIEALIDGDHFKRLKGRTYNLLLRVVAIILKVFKDKSFGIEKLSAEDLKAAEDHCLKESMKLTKKEMDSGKLKSIRPRIDDDGVIVLGSRAEEGFKAHYGNERFPILTYKDPFSHLWMKHVHSEDHSGITRTVAKSRRKYWIVRGRRLAEQIRSSCYRCRLLDKLMAMQQMAPLPSSRLAMSPPFHMTSMDLFGPIEIKDTVKQRTRKKVWGVIFDCAATRALHLDLTEDYSTDAILQTIRRFVAIRGCPTEIQSDQGSQLIAAAKDIADLVRDWDWNCVSTWATNQKIKWTVVPAEGQHQNGLSESLIKSVKRSIKLRVGPHTCTFGELQMIMFEIANIINSRPIGITTGCDPEDPKPLTPNDLLLGRSTGEVPQGPFDSNKSITKRFRFLQQIITDWWDHWYRVVLPTLVPSYKWLQRHRNVQVGDVCLIRYGKDKRATYRLGRVKEVKKGSDNLVRKVTLQYKLPSENKFRSVDRPIQGIAVIVPVEEQTEAKKDEMKTKDEVSLQNTDTPLTSHIDIKTCNCNVVKTQTLNPHAAVYIPNTDTCKHVNVPDVQ